MIVDAVTTRYAGALYGLARKHGAIDAVTKDVAALAAEIGRTATRSLIFNPRVEREARTRWVRELGDEGALLDGNHPLAGLTLTFDLELVSVQPSASAP